MQGLVQNWMAIVCIDPLYGKKFSLAHLLRFQRCDHPGGRGDRSESLREIQFFVVRFPT
jgi:hypothetical protein